MNTNRDTLQKNAMHYGLFMGGFWIFKYLFFILSFKVSLLQIVYLSLTMMVPLVAYTLTKHYRENLGGTISFFHAWRFGVMMYFFAALLVSLVQFIFYRFIAPPDFLAKTFDAVISVMNTMSLNPKIAERMSDVSEPTPIIMAIQGIFNNVFYGIILSIPVALLVRKGETK